MIYALIENGVVVNLIWLYEGNAHEFPNAVPLEGRQVSIGDKYTNGVFTSNGSPIHTTLEEAGQLISDLDASVVELAYQNVMLELRITE